jgi:hypothetical protein
MFKLKGITMFSPLGKIFIFWFSILTLTAVFQRLLPINDYSWATDYALLIVATLAFFHGSCTAMYKVCSWILKKRCPDEMEGFESGGYAIRSRDAAVYRHTPHASFTRLS